MYNNWYKVAKIQKEAGMAEMIPTALLFALMAVMGGSTILNAAQRFHVEPQSIEEALTNPQIMQSLQGNSEQNISQEQKNQSDQPTLVNSATFDDNLLESLKRLEGTVEYQKYKGYFRNEKFYPYKDTKGYPTVGYGHRILKGENFNNGITPAEAEKLLLQDAQIALQGANSLLQKTPVTPEAAQVIANMVFQMGKDGVAGFKKMWLALANQDYPEAAKEMLDSKWAKKDSPNRAKELSDIMARQ